MVSVPKVDSTNVLKLIRQMGKVANLFVIPVVPGKNALRNECFENVNRHIDMNGGERVIGWQLWELSHFIEAEYHAVWRSPSGDMVDITPKNVEIDEILFLVDHDPNYTFRIIDNIRLNTSGNNLVDDYIALAETKYYMFNGGDKATLKTVNFRKDEIDIINYVSGMMTEIEVLLAKNGSRNSVCFCSSNTKYKHCHGKDLISYLNTIKS